MRGVDAQGIGDIRTLVQIVHVERLDMIDAFVDQPLQQVTGQLVVGAGKELTGGLVHDVVGKNLAMQIVCGHNQVS